MSAMDIKLHRSQGEVGEPPTSKRRWTFTFLRDLKEELRKVSWTSREELAFATKAVVGTTFFMGLSIYFVDLVIKGSLDVVAWVVRYIFG